MTTPKPADARPTIVNADVPSPDQGLPGPGDEASATHFLSDTVTADPKGEHVGASGPAARKQRSKV